jgi:hypothetical protein
LDIDLRAVPALRSSDDTVAQPDSDTRAWQVKPAIPRPRSAVPAQEE